MEWMVEGGGVRDVEHQYFFYGTNNYFKYTLCILQQHLVVESQYYYMYYYLLLINSFNVYYHFECSGLRKKLLMIN